ncbi:GntR family transcriptional regulator [Roseiarcus sp.]|uniref:GntR family transcriptional regulator n=1 Tax=Roseiarcus sp. TaxID=1969460 RepID=UPI003F98C132
MTVAHERVAGSGAAPTLTEALHERLRQDIILGVLSPGAKLKLEKLSRAYDVSVNTLRETLARLAADGLVVAEGQKGFAVLPVSTEDLREITEMRQLLECHALKQSIAAADLDWEARVMGAYHKLSRVEEFVEADPDAYGEPWEAANEAFHEALISNCRSRWLRLYLRAMYDHSRRYRMLSLRTRPFPRSQSAAEHRRILDAAIARDGERAQALLAEHILKAAELAAPVKPSAS